MPQPDATTDPPVVPPPILDPPAPGRSRSERRAARRHARRRRLRRIGCGVGVVALCTTTWVALGHTDRVGEVAMQPTGADEDVRAPEPEPARSGRLDEPGGLITGPLGIVPGAEHRVVDNHLVVVGDSVMQAAAPLLPAQLSNWSIVADTRVGRFLPEAIEVLRRRKDQLGEIVVLNLGNNYHGDEVAFAAEVEEAMTVLSSVDEVIWVTVGEYEPQQEEVNAVLRRAAELHSNLVLLDWNTLWQKSDSWTGADDLHLTPEGAEAYARFVARGVRRVARLADLSPAPHPEKPEIVTKGSVPASGRNGSGSGSTSRRRTTTTSSPRRRPRTTTPARPVAPTTVAPTPQGGDEPGAGTGSGSGAGDTPSAPPETTPPDPPSVGGGATGG